MSGTAERPDTADGTKEARDLHPRKFDFLNLTLVDVKGALRPSLNVFLLVHREWSATTVGLATTIAGLIGGGL